MVDGHELSALEHAVGAVQLATIVIPAGRAGASLLARTEAVLMAPSVVPAARFAAIRSALTDAAGNRLVDLERRGMLYTIERVEKEGYKLIGSIKYGGNQGIDLAFQGVRSNSGRVAFAEAKASGGLGALTVDSQGIRQGGKEFLISRLKRAGRTDLVEALNDGLVDSFAGSAAEGKLWKFDLMIFVKDVNFARTPGAATLVPP